MAQDLDFSGKSILITGAASGIGAACASWLAQRGAKRLVLVDLDEAGLAALELPCPSKPFTGDVADPALWERIEAEAGPLDHAVLNAGVGASGAVAELSFEDWRRVMAVNLDGAFLSLRTALRLMVDGGSAVLTASAIGLKATPTTAAYGSSKAAVMQLMRVAAKESAARGIRINAIAPGGVDTPIWDKQPVFVEAFEAMGRAAALDSMARQSVPLGRFETADEIAAQIGFLLSGMAGTITGTVLVSDGGYVL
jgi:NAD(P)-dependent dehydrogenase (short-subunit alcohol dehydrogenase family)